MTDFSWVILASVRGVNNMVEMSQVDIRDALFDELYRIGSMDPNVIVLTDDMDAFSLRRFRKDMPSQFVNIGVAEQNMINVAAGLAMCGKRVFTYGICSYVTMRCYEQIKVNLCSMNLPVTIIGVGQGFSFDFDGPTHHGISDLALMRILPDMTIYNLSDASMAHASVSLAYQSNKPVYIRLDKGVFPVLSDSSEDFSKGYRIIKPLRNLNILATGFMTSQALKAVDVLEASGIEVGVVDIFRVHPISDMFIQEVVHTSQQLITVEENVISGGLGTILSELITRNGFAIGLKSIAIEDKQFLSYGERDWFHAQTQIDVSNIVDQIIEFYR